MAFAASGFGEGAFKPLGSDGLGTGMDGFEALGFGVRPFGTPFCTCVFCSCHRQTPGEQRLEGCIAALPATLTQHMQERGRAHWTES